MLKKLIKADLSLEDLKDVISEEELESFRSLKDYSNEDLESCYLTFSINVNGKQIELIENG